MKEEKMFKKILVCLDGSELAEKVLPFAIEQAVRFGSELILFRAVSEPYLVSLDLPGMPGVPINSGVVKQKEFAEKNQAMEYLKALAAKIQAENKLEVSYDSAIGPAEQTIVEYSNSHQIELIAIATHGRSGPGRVILGSVAGYVIRHSLLPILLIRPAKDKIK
jgi:nucleotide-binding universal stress UspA family protein